MFALKNKNSGNLLRLYVTLNDIFQISDGDIFTNEPIFVHHDRNIVEMIASNITCEIPDPNYNKVRNNFAGECEIVELMEKVK